MARVIRYRICARPESANPVAQTVARMMMPMVKGKLERDRRASKVALLKLVADDLAANPAQVAQTA